MYAIVFSVLLAAGSALPSATQGGDAYSVTADDQEDDFGVEGTDSAWQQDTEGPRKAGSPQKPPVKYFRADLQQCALTDLDRPDPTLLDQACA